MSRSGCSTVLLALVLVGLTVTPVAGITSATDGAAGPTHRVAGSDSVVTQTETPTDPENETSQHEDPDAVNEDGDTNDLKRWLSGKLGGRLSRSAIQIDQGQYEQGQALLGDSYDGLLGKYVDVTGSTGDETDDQVASQFQTAREEQQNLSANVQEYRETVEQYRQARQNGNDTRARQLARKANRIADEINTSTTTLNRTYESIGNGTNTEFTRAIQSLANINQEISSQQAAINEDLFVETTLSVRVADSQIAFSNPTTVSGRLAANGSAVANRTLTLRIGTQSLRTVTDADGQFSVRYRPTIVPVGEQNLTAEFVPANSSVYLGSKDTVPVTISQTTPNLTLETVSSTLSFGDSVEASGRLVAGEEGVGGVPVVIVADGVRLTTLRTDSDGTVDVDASLPAAVRNGSRDIQARVALSDKAIASVTARQQVMVTATATELTIRSEKQDDGPTRITGTFRTADGRPLGNQQLILQVENETLGTVQTDSDGQFSTTLSASALRQVAPQGNSASLTAVYSGTETSLESARATTTVQVPPTPAENNGDTSILPEVTDDPASVLSEASGNPLVWLFGLFVLVVFGVLWVRRSPTSTSEETATDAPSPATETPAAQQHSSDSEHLSVAKAKLETGDFEPAAKAAYAATRTRMSSMATLPSGGTHWECYAACENADIDSDVLSALRDITEIYEQAAFAPISLTDDLATRAVARAEELTSDTAGGAE